MINFLIRKFYASKIPKGNGAKVAVGLSGGVDSSVSAAILKDRGYDVTGVFIKVWQPDFLTCTWKEDRRDAMRVCSELGIDFITIDLEQEYKKNVVDYMINEYESGHTPNPDVMCNTYVKFGAFYNWAMDNDFKYVATGHYAQVTDAEGQKMLAKGLDKSKDQSYFLWQIKKESLENIIFPIGHIPKNIVRKIATSFKLHTATKKDSQGLCFLGHVDIYSFLSRFIKLKEGDVVDLKGNKIGTHRGAPVYTIGQRHGFSITDKKSSQETLYVVKKNVTKNTITVSKDPSDYSHDFKKVPLRGVYFRNLPKNDLVLDAQIRYHGKYYGAQILDHNQQSATIEFKEKPEGLAEGQSVVIYLYNECIGGGIVDSPVIQ